MHSKEFRTELIKGWNNYPAVQAKVYRPERIEGIAAMVSQSKTSILARGGGTSFGDSSINNNGINVDTRRLNKMLHFDSKKGVLHCQCGVTLQDVARVFIPRGWFLQVTPGTQFATVGGGVATDAHGKNWKAGSFCNFVKGLHLMLQDGSIVYCDEENNPDIFYSTFGGMGMTGIILDVRIQLRKVTSSLIDVETIPCRNLKECFEVQFDSMESHEYIFCWLDSHKEGANMGRGVLQRANHCQNNKPIYKEKRRIHVPFYMPSFTVNEYSVEAFNGAYYASVRGKNRKKAYIMDFFYPLDSIANWYKVYGRRGFVEYQMVVPFEGAYEVVSEILKVVTKSKLGSTVAAIKPMIKAKGVMSFPMNGITFAVDFMPGQKLWQVLDKLDEMVIANCGRVYLAKDARLSSKNFRQMYSKTIDSWESVRQKYNLKNKFSSMMFNRLYKD